MAVALARRMPGTTTVGNPFWALEVGRALVRQPGDPAIDLPLPASLIAVVADRLAGPDSAARAALIAVSALACPTVSLALQALDGVVANPGPALDTAVTAGVVMETSGKLRPRNLCWVTRRWKRCCRVEGPTWPGCSLPAWAGR